jgi:creatinine amidohydrolase
VDVSELATVWLTEMTQPEAAAALAKGTAILVTGSVEQHGGHLPLGTDAYAALAVAERVAARIGAPALQVTAVGVAPYHLPWPGSLSLTPATFMGLLTDICAGLSRAGVTRVLIVNWHEGNTPAIRLAGDTIQQQFPLRVVVAETHIITNSLFPDEMEFTHAGSMETAAVLAHRPDLVRLSDRTPGADMGQGIANHALFRRRDVFPILADFREIAGTGWYGSPDSIDRQRAEEIFGVVADHAVNGFRSVCEKLDEFDELVGSPTVEESEGRR